MSTPILRCVSEEEKAKITSTMEDIAKCLQNHEPVWTDRLKAIDQLRSLLNSDVVEDEYFVNLLHSVQGPLCVQLEDRRSALCKEVCGTLALMATRLQERFDQFARAYVEALSKLLVVTIRVIAEPAHVCILILLPYASSTVPVLAQGIKDKHPTIRARSTEYLCKVVETISAELLAPYLDSIVEGTKSAIMDSSPDARAFGKRCYQAIVKNWPDTAQSLLSSLDPTIQKRLTEPAQAAKKPAGGFRQFLVNKKTTTPVVGESVTVIEPLAAAPAIIAPAKCDFMVNTLPTFTPVEVVIDAPAIGTTLDVSPVERAPLNTTYPTIEGAIGDIKEPAILTHPSEPTSILGDTTTSIEQVVDIYHPITTTVDTTPATPVAELTSLTLSPPPSFPPNSEGANPESLPNNISEPLPTETLMETLPTDNTELPHSDSVQPPLDDDQMPHSDAVENVSPQPLFLQPAKPKQPKRKIEPTTFEDKENVSNSTTLSTPSKSKPVLTSNIVVVQPSKKSKHAHLLNFQPGSTPIALRVKSRRTTTTKGIKKLL